jgi:hypothetical protein
MLLWFPEAPVVFGVLAFPLVVVILLKQNSIMDAMQHTKLTYSKVQNIILKADCHSAYQK